MKCMSTIVGSLNNTYKLEEISFSVPRLNGAAALEPGEIAFQDSMANLAAHYYLQLVGNRIVRQYQLLRGWPIGCCLFLRVIPGFAKENRAKARGTT